MRHFLATLVLLCCYGFLTAQVPENEQKNQPKQLDLQIQLPQATDSVASDPAPSDLTLGGMVIDETVSKLGHDFYEVFFASWEEVPGAGDYLILIRERPLPSLGSIISISLDSEVLWEQRLSPQREIIEQLAFEAAAFFYQYLANYNQIRDAQKTEDLEGSGIY